MFLFCLYTCIGSARSSAHKSNPSPPSTPRLQPARRPAPSTQTNKLDLRHRKMYTRPPGAIVSCKLLWPKEPHLFIKWQETQPQTISPHKEYLSSAEEHHRFTSRPHFDDNNRFLTLGNLPDLVLPQPQTDKPDCAQPASYECAHKPHPSAQSESFCPVCQVEHSIDFLSAISEAWARRGGPWRNPTRKSTNGYIALKMGWRRARLELSSLVARLEREEVREREFDEWYREEVGVCGAGMALRRLGERYRESFGGMVSAVGVGVEGKMGAEGEGGKRVGERVRFSEGVMGPSPQMGEYYREMYGREVLEAHAPP